jgi:hypothetical protein
LIAVLGDGLILLRRIREGHCILFSLFNLVFACILMDSAELGSSEPPIYNAALGDYEQHYLSLLKSIASLQWVRESLPSHTRYYESLKNKLKNEEMTRQLLEDNM